MSESSQNFIESRQTSTEKLNSIGIEVICERISNGESDGEIAETLEGVSKWSLNQWLNRSENISQSARAREESAESWLDKGIKPLKDGLLKDAGYDAGMARAYAQECARRAAIRNPKYRDRTETAVTGGDGGAIKVQDVTPLDSARRIAMALALGMSKLDDKNG